MSEKPVWSVPLKFEDVPEAGRQVSLSADAATRAAVAAQVDVKAIHRLEAAFTLARRGHDGLHVSGEVTALVEQICIVSLEPLENTIVEAVDVDYVPPAAAPDRPAVAVNDDADVPEYLQDGGVDLGALAVEFLILGIDPYPRKPGVTFVAPAADPAADSPFAALAKLRTLKN